MVYFCLFCHLHKWTHISLMLCIMFCITFLTQHYVGEIHPTECSCGTFAFTSVLFYDYTVAYLLLFTENIILTILTILSLQFITITSFCFMRLKVFYIHVSLECDGLPYQRRSQLLERYDTEHWRACELLMSLRKMKILIQKAWATAFSALLTHSQLVPKPQIQGHTCKHGWYETFTAT